MKLETFKEHLIQQVSNLRMSAEEAFERYEDAFTRSEDGINLTQDGVFSKDIDSDFIKVYREVYEECEVV